MPISRGDATVVVNVLSAGAMSEIVRALGGMFEQRTGIAVAAEFSRSGVVGERLRAGDAADIAISTQAVIDELARRGHVVADSIAPVACSGIGVAVRAGAPRPDIGSLAAFRDALCRAASIAYADPASGSPSGNYLVGLFDRLGLTAELKPKTRLVGASGGHAVVVCDIVARGDAELGIQQIAEIVPVTGVDLVGPLPAEIQHMTVFCAAVSAKAHQPDAARRFVHFISSDAAKPVIVAKGMEPG
jgi:molybdate transport system substrate-binding protein